MKRVPPDLDRLMWTLVEDGDPAPSRSSVSDSRNSGPSLENDWP